MRALVLLLAALLACGPLSAAPEGAAKRKAARTAPPKPEPYDPDRVRAGRTPGFIDLGNGTELRVGGRVRLDYDLRR